MLSFLSPLFLVGGLAAAVPVILHLLKREPEPRVKFSVVKLLKRAPVEHTEKHRLRELLLLALRVATLLLLALAFARPFLASGSAARAGGVTIVALDTSYSMAAPGRFERARQLARDVISRLRPSDLVGVVTFADEAELVAKPTADRVLATSAVEQASPGFGATRYRAALATSAQALNAVSGGRGTIVVVTDLQESGWDEGDRASISEGARVEIADVGPLPPNLAVTAVHALANSLVATIRNGGERARDVRARLVIDGRAVAEASAAVGPRQSEDVTFPGPPRGDAATVTVDDPEGVSADNSRYTTIGWSNRPRVLLVTSNGNASRDGFYVQHALAVGSAGRNAYDVTLMSGAQLSSEPASRPRDSGLSAYSSVLLLSTRGLERRGRERLAGYVRDGGGLLVAAGPDFDGEVAGDVLGVDTGLKIMSVPGPRPQIHALAPADARHPVFRAFAGTSATLGLVRFRNLARIEGRDCQTLARFTTGDRALIECAAGEGRVLVFASDLDNQWNDFPLHASFVPFVHEALRYLSSIHAHASEYSIAEAPAGLPRRPGVYSLDTGVRGMQRVAINVDPRETDPARLTAEEFQSAVTHLNDNVVPAARIEARQQEDNQHLWQYALVLMVLTLTVEGVIAARTA